MTPEQRPVILGTVLLLFITSRTIAADRSNILFLITDQHHARMLLSAGNPYLKTRALDSMARSGIRFSRAYVSNPVCVPSRISMATGSHGSAIKFSEIARFPR